MNFEFATAARIVFGAGRRIEIFAAARSFGHRALVVTGRDAHRTHWLLDGLRKEGVEAEVFPVAGEPTIHRVSEGAAQARASRAESVIACGGGSAIDAAKAIAALATNPRPILDYLEVVGRGMPLEVLPLPFLALPTTAGTGAEVTRNSVLSVPEERVKASLRSPKLLARLAIVDPELTHGLPHGITAATGLDALTQLIEPFVSSRANPMTDALCREALPCAARALLVLAEGREEAGARLDMAFASLCGGLALANAGLGAVHGFAAPLGGMFEAPHGAVCAALLPEVMEANWHAAEAGRAKTDTVARLSEVAALLTGDDKAGVEDGIHWVQRVRGAFGLRGLGFLGVDAASIHAVADKASHASSMKANPVLFTREELEAILQQAL